MTSEHNTTAERSSRDVPFVFHQYQLLAKRGYCPAISYAEQWDKYIAIGEVPTQNFDTFEEYYQEFPLDIEVHDAQEQLAVTESGTGGYTRWLCRYLPEADGPGWVILILQEAEPDFPETKINIFHAEEGLPDETENALPSLSPAVFFNEEKAKSTAEIAPMVSMWMEFGQESMGLRLVPIVNRTYVCEDGLPAVSNLTQGEKEAVCDAWHHFVPEPISLTWNPETTQYQFNQQ